MDIELLKTFLEVSQTKHFSKAADRLFLTQSAVSARIRLLEAQLNCQLFQRDKKQVQLTTEGEKFVIYAQEMLYLWQQAKQEFSHKPTIAPILHIASTAQFWHFYFQQHISAQQVNTQLHTFNHTDAWLALENRQLDLWLGCKAATEQVFNQQNLFESTLCLVAHNAMADNFTWQKTPYAHIHWSAGFEQFKQRTIANHLPHFIRSDNAALIIPLINEGHCCAYLPESLLTQYPQLKKIEHIKAPAYKQTISAFYLSHHPQKARIQKIIDALKANAASCS